FNEIGPVQGFAVEFVLTIQLVLCVFAATDHRRDVSAFAPLAAGSSVVVGHLAGVILGAAPERAGVTAGVLYDHLLCPRSEPLCERARAPWGCEDCKVDDGGAEIQQAPAGRLSRCGQID
ncbi:hypothetical protein CRUP_038579, partial [Coryphaenoides rupestris]